MQQKLCGLHHQPEWYRALHGLAEASTLHLLHARLEARVLRLRQVRPRRSAMPSCGGTLRRSPPLNADAWDSALRELGLHERYHFIPNSIRHGFNAGIPAITRTSAPKNSASLLSFPGAFDSLVAREFNSGRYLGPLTLAKTESLLGPFQSSPMSLVPKPHKPNKHRLVQNLSFPKTPSLHSSSINLAIDSNNFPCLWGTFLVVSLLLWSLPPRLPGGIPQRQKSLLYCSTRKRPVARDCGATGGTRQLCS